MPLLREEAERMATILEAVLARLSWPQDANHIVNIRSTLETIKSTLFTNLVDIHTQCVDGISDAAHVVEGNTLEMHPQQQLVSSFQQQHHLNHAKETSVDDDVTDTACLHAITLNSPVQDCVVLGNQVAMEMQEPLTNGHNMHNEQNETTFVANNNSTETDKCSEIITNKQCEPDHKLPSPNYKQSEPDYKPPSPSQSAIEPAECKHKLPASRDILFPMRDQRSLSEIKQTLQRRADWKDQET